MSDRHRRSASAGPRRSGSAGPRRTAWPVAGVVACVAALIGLTVILVPSSSSTAPGDRSAAGTRAAQARVHAPSSSASTLPPSTPSAAKPVVAAAAPVPSPCARNRNGQLVVVSLTQQRMWLCHRGATTREFSITSGRDGRGDATPTGSFHVQGRNRNSVLDPGNRGKGYDVKYWLPFDAPNYGFHDASWQHAGYGSSNFRAAHGSQGCVHMPLPAIRFFYNWVHMGTAVHITRA